MFGTPGKEEGCLWYPRKVVVMKNTTGNFVVCDRGCERSRMQIFSPQVIHYNDNKHNERDHFSLGSLNIICGK